LEAFAQFGADLDKATQARINRGRRTAEILKQVQYVPLPVEKQVMIIYAAINGYLDEIALEDVAKFEQEFYRYMDQQHSEIGGQIAETSDLDEQTETALQQAILDFKQQFVI
jgi:F-type H+-transporting ATPase subunit alpha